jgi:DNA-binding transcriptional LysR family regulator
MAAFPDLTRLRSFVVLVAEGLHYTKASDRLHISQPGLTQQIHKLEEETGAALIERSGRAYALTPIGRLVAEEATALLVQAKAAQQRIEAAVRGQSGRLRLAYTRSARGGRVDALIARFRAENPYVEVVAETGWTAPNVAGLLAGRLDAAFVRPPVPEAGLRCRFVDTEELLLATPADHPMARRRLIPRELLVGEPTVMWPRENGPGMYDSIVGQVWPAGGFNLVRHEPDDEQLMRAVASGAVVAVVPAGRARALRVAGVRLRRFAPPRPTADIALAHPVRAVSPMVLRLLALLDELVADPIEKSFAAAGPGVGV